MNKQKNYMVESILVTLFCCLPLGIVGIINASKVDAASAAGNDAEAQRLSAEAYKWVKYGFFAGIAVIVLYVIFIFLVGGAAMLGR
jgi:hypothetical protein